MIIGFMVVNFYFIFNIVLRTGDDKVKFFTAFKYLFMSSWIVIVSWFVLGVFVYYCKQSGRPYKSDAHKENVNYMMKIFALWSLAFIIKIVLSFLTLFYSFQ